jgi:putative hemolysin
VSALAAWWSNPVTAVLVWAALMTVLCLWVSGLLAVVRAGAIQLGGILAQRPRLLPGYPRRADAYASLIVFLEAGVGVLLVVFSLATTRAGRLLGVSHLGVLAVLLSSWLLATLIGVALARGPRGEQLAVATLVALKAWTPILRWLERVEGPESQPVEGEDEEVDEHEVQAFIGAGEDAGILEKEDAELVASIVDLSDTVAREILTPRTDVVALPVTGSFAELERLFAESMFTRIPIYRDTLDRIEGVVHVKDVLRAVANGEKPAVSSLVRPVSIVPETKPVRELLREFQAAHQQMAVVVDEYGGTAGVVTLEDVIEEIVGEIQDEHQRESPEVAKEADGVYLLSGAAHVEILEELFGTEVGEVDFDSVAGLVLDRLGHLPKVGEHASWRRLDLEVVEVDRRRVRRVRVRRPEDAGK